MKKLYLILIMTLFFSCSVEFEGSNGIHYKFKSKHVDFIKEVFIKNISTEITVEKNVECTGYGYCNDWEDGYGYYYDCDGKRSYVKYRYREDLCRKDLKLLGGRLIEGKEYIKETEIIIEQSKCIVK